MEKETKRLKMKESLKLDRRIMCIDSSGVWKNAHQLRCERPDWMTSAQQNRLTAKLYAAAKRGEQIVVEINGRRFKLVTVGAQ